MDLRDEVLPKTSVSREFRPPADAWPSVSPTRLVDWTEAFNLAAYLVERNLAPHASENHQTFPDRSADVVGLVT